MSQDKILQLYEAAMKAYQEKSLDVAESISKQVLAKDPKYSKVLHLLGYIYKDRGQLQQAIQFIQASIREDEFNPIPFLDLGKILVLAGQHEHAALAFQESLKRNCQIPETWFCLGNLYMATNRPIEAIDSYVRTLRLDSSYIDAEANLEQLYFQESKWSELCQLLEQKLLLNPSNFAALANHGTSLLKLGKFRDSIAQFRSALQLSPQNPSVLFNLGSALLEFGDRAEAIVNYRSAILLKPDFAEAYSALGAIYRDNDEIEQARISFEKLIEIKPDFISAYMDLATLNKLQGKIQNAIACYRKVIDLDPGFTEAYIQLATIYHEEHRVADALNLYRIVYAKDSNQSLCVFHLSASGFVDQSSCFRELQFQIRELLNSSFTPLPEDILFLRCLWNFSNRCHTDSDAPFVLGSDVNFGNLSSYYSKVLDHLFDLYSLCRKSLLPRWLVYEGRSKRITLLSDYLEFLNAHPGGHSEYFQLIKNYQLSLLSSSVSRLDISDHLFSLSADIDEELWLISEKYQFPELDRVLSLQDSLLEQVSHNKVTHTNQSEFFRKTHLLEAQNFYMPKRDPCLHGASELYRVHSLIARTVEELPLIQQVVDLGYYSGGIFNAGLNPSLYCYCIEPSKHHSAWLSSSGVAQELSRVCDQCVRSFDEYLARLKLVSLENNESTVVVISFALQLFDYDQCLNILKVLKGLAYYLIIADDILNEYSDESILRLLASGDRMNLCHNYSRLLQDAGWKVEKKSYFYGVRYANGIIVAKSY